MNNQSKIINMNKSKKCVLRSIGWLLFVSFLLGCSSDNGEPLWGGEDGEDEPDVVVTFSTGNSSTITRTAFADGTPVKMYVYRRSSSGIDLSTAPYKIAEGHTASGDGVVSDVVFTGGNITDEGQLTVRGNSNYDFVVVVNASPNAKFTDFGVLGLGILSGFGHGSDILSGRKENVRVNGQESINVVFTEYGADAQGRLPHLCSAVCTEGRVTGALLNHLGGQLRYAVAGMDFTKCLPQSANLPFGGNPMALSVQAAGYTTSYSAAVLGNEVIVNDVARVAESSNGILLPCPLRFVGQDYNSMNIDFRLRVNGGEVLFQAPGVLTPPFRPGYRYRFIVELDYDPSNNGSVNLYLSVEPWNSTSWENGMGEGENTESSVILSLGSWSSVAWESSMGGEDGSMVITSVAGWRSASWSSIMGEHN